MRHVFLAVLLTLPAASSPAVDVHDIHGELAAKIADPELRDMTQRVLRKMDTDYEGVAKKGLTAKGERFDHARVEVTGVASGDNTYKVNQTDFDRQIKPSFFVEESGWRATIQRAIKKAHKLVAPPLGPAETAFEAMRDSVEFERAAAGEVTPHAKELLKPYKDKEINEIVAHSWGTELVYAAILNGDLLPPKKLIVVGVPDDDYPKWELLAARTGTEVHWVRSANDEIAKIGAAIAKKNSSVSYEAKWDALCADAKKKRSCHAHNRKSKPVNWEPIKDNPGTAGHDRIAYYALLKENEVIKGTVHDLRADETATKEAEIRLVKKAALEAAIDEARGLLAEARRKAFEAAFNDQQLRERKMREAEEVLRQSLQQSPASAPAKADIIAPFASILPQLKAFSLAACRAPEQVSIDMQLRRAYAHYYREHDDNIARDLSSGLDGCPRQLFNQMIATHRAGEYWRIDRQWVRDMVAAYSRASDASPGYAAPPPPRRCEDYGNIRCP